MNFDLTQPGSGELQLQVLRSIIGDSSQKTLIDLCCGEMTVSRHLKFASSVHVDVTDEPLRPRHAVFVHSDVFGDHPVFKTRYNVALCADGIEHFTKADGFRLAHQMTMLADLSIVFTPLGEYMVDPLNTGPHTHKSGWLPDDLPGWHTLVFPNWHPTLNCGALFYWHDRHQNS